MESPISQIKQLEFHQVYRVEVEGTRRRVLLNEFRQLRSIGVKVNNNIPKDTAFNLLPINSIPVTAQNVANATKNPIYQVIDSLFVQDFSNRLNIIYCVQTG